MSDNKNFCPYPHPEPAELLSNLALFGHSDSGCGHPLVACPNGKCGKPNRSVARHCTRCGAVIDLDAIERNVLEATRLQQNPLPLFDSIDLARYDATNVVELLTALGYLFVRTHGAGVLVFCGYHPEKPVYQIHDDSEAAGMTFVPSRQNSEGKMTRPYLLVSSAQRIWSVDFLPQFDQIEQTIRGINSEHLFFQPFETAKGLAYFLRKEDQTRLALWTQKGVGKVWEGAFNIGPPLQTASGRIVFFSAEKVWIFRPEYGESLLEIPARSPLDPENYAAYDVVNNEVIIPGKGRLYKIKPDADPPALTPVGDKDIGSFRLSAGTDGQFLYMGSQSGIAIVDSYRGDGIWSLDANLSIKVDCRQYPPRQFGPYLAFVAHSKRGTRQIGLLHVRQRGNVFWAGNETDIKAPPVICGDKLIAATANANRPELKVFKLT